MEFFFNQRRLFTEGTWIAFGQVSAVVGTLAGIRILTEFVPPHVYGSVTLLLGITALGLGTVFNPIMQAALRFYPECSSHDLPALRHIMMTILRRRSVLSTVCVVAMWPIGQYFWSIPWTMIVLIPLLFSLDGLRTLETVLLNAARKQRAYATFAIAEAWGRPICAVCALQMFGPSVESMLIGYAAATACVLLCFYYLGQPEGLAQRPPIPLDRPALWKSIQTYSLPLIPTAAMGWISGMGDRYLIGGMLGLEQVGIYAAIYGLLSRPFLMATGIIELTLRPIYYQYIAAQAHHQARSLLWKWLGLVALVSGAGFVAILLAKNLIVNLLLAEEYRAGVNLVPWIAGGYGLLVLSHVFEKICFAYERTGMVLFIQSLGAVLGLAIAFIGIAWQGLLGAAMAVPVYFGVQLIISIVVARRTEIEALRRRTNVHEMEPTAPAERCA